MDCGFWFQTTSRFRQEGDEIDEHVGVSRDRYVAKATVQARDPQWYLDYYAWFPFFQLYYLIRKKGKKSKFCSFLEILIFLKMSIQMSSPWSL